MICDSDGGHAEFFDSADEAVDAVAAVEEGVFGVEVEVNEVLALVVVVLCGHFSYWFMRWSCCGLLRWFCLRSFVQCTRRVRDGRRCVGTVWRCCL